jgi:hypothetical protein
MTEETLEETATTIEGDPPAPETAVDSESTAVEQQKEETTETSETPAKEAAEEAKPATWDGFELKAPEGHDKASLTAFGEAAKEQDISPDAAQKMIDKMAPVLQEASMSNLNALHKQWIEASKSDELIGGDQFDENMAIAKKGAEAFGDDELQTMLKPVSEGGQGLGNNPVINRLLFRVGKAIGTDTKLVKGSPAKADANKAQNLYGESKMNE